jgi:DTW domain-containing protein YfiP
VAVDCLCHALKPERAAVVVGVLQHPREARVAKSTGPLITLAFDNAFLLCALDLDGDGALGQRLGGLAPGPVGLLFPEGAAPIDEAPPDLRCLLVPDGSWSQARAILSSTVSLRGLPRYALPPGLRGHYPIRKPQGPGRLSTLEATVAALRALAGDDSLHQAALELQAALVERQLAHMRAGGARHPALGTGSWKRSRGGDKQV